MANTIGLDRGVGAGVELIFGAAIVVVDMLLNKRVSRLYHSVRKIEEVDERWLCVRWVNFISLPAIVVCIPTYVRGKIRI